MNATPHTAIVTGGSEGLGLALTVALAERGWNVVVDARHSQLLIEAVAPLGPSVVAVPGDINDPTHRLALVASATGVSDDGRIDLIINNASTLGPLPMPALLQLPPTDLVGVLTTNVVSPLALIQVAASHLTVDGCIINITSDAGVAAYEGWGGYGTSKSALDQLSRILAVEQPTWRVYAVDQAICAPPCIRMHSPVKTSAIAHSRSTAWPASWPSSTGHNRVGDTALRRCGDGDNCYNGGRGATEGLCNEA